MEFTCEGLSVSAFIERILRSFAQEEPRLEAARELDPDFAALRGVLKGPLAEGSKQDARAAKHEGRLRKAHPAAPGFPSDVNVILDYLEDREPHARYAQALFAAAKSSEARLWVSGDSASTFYYVLEKGFRQGRVKQPSLMAQAAILSISSMSARLP